MSATATNHPAAFTTHPVSEDGIGSAIASSARPVLLLPRSRSRPASTTCSSRSTRRRVHGLPPRPAGTRAFNGPYGDEYHPTQVADLDAILTVTGARQFVRAHAQRSRRPQRAVAPPIERVAA